MKAVDEAEFEIEDDGWVTVWPDMAHRRMKENLEYLIMNTDLEPLLRALFRRYEEWTWPC